jgi:Methylamine utilisation protein MauE
MAINLMRGRTYIDCGCFDASLRQPLRWSLVVRNALLVLLLAIAAQSRDAAQAWDLFTLTMGVLAGAAFFMVVQCANILTALPAKRRTT